jgi:hypothetical protein
MTVKMKKIDLKPYKVELPTRQPDGSIEAVSQDYDVKDVIVGIMFSRDLQLSARETLDRDPLCRRILDAEDSILLESADYDLVKKAVETIKGYSRNDVQMIRRILEAPEVEVEEVPKGEILEEAPEPQGGEDES